MLYNSFGKVVIIKMIINRHNNYSSIHNDNIIYFHLKRIYFLILIPFF